MINRRARPRPHWSNVSRTIVAVAVLQALWFWAIPLLLMQMHWAIGDTRLAFPALRLLATCIFVAGGIVHLGAALILAIGGRGTPMHVDGPRRLVTRGLYAHLRNPMVATAFVQALAVAMFGGSYILVGYALLWLALWQLFVRRAEEYELVRLFGREYEIYRRGVPALVPRMQAWQAIDDAPTRKIVVDDQAALHHGRRRRA